MREGRVGQGLHCFALGDILRRHDSVVWRAIRGPYQRGGEVDPDWHTILADVALIGVVRVQLACQQALEHHEMGLAVVGVGEVLAGERLELRAAVAEDVAEPRVDAQPAPLQTDESEADIRMFEYRP